MGLCNICERFSMGLLNIEICVEILFCVQHCNTVDVGSEHVHFVYCWHVYIPCLCRMEYFYFLYIVVAVSASLFCSLLAVVILQLLLLTFLNWISVCAVQVYACYCYFYVNDLKYPAFVQIESVHAVVYFILRYSAGPLSCS